MVLMIRGNTFCDKWVEIPILVYQWALSLHKTVKIIQAYSLQVSDVVGGCQPIDGLTVGHAEEADDPQQHDGLTVRLVKLDLFKIFKFFHFYPLLVPHLIPCHLLMKTKYKTEKT